MYRIQLAYLVKNDENENVQLAYSCKDQKDRPLFIDTWMHIPAALFDGAKTSAAITIDRGIIIITENIYQTQNAHLETAFISNNDKAIKISCCDKFVYALGSSCNVYQCISINDVQPSFVEIPFFAGKHVVDIAGSHRHALVVL